MYSALQQQHFLVIKMLPPQDTDFQIFQGLHAIAPSLPPPGGGAGASFIMTQECTAEIMISFC